MPSWFSFPRHPGKYLREAKFFLDRRGGPHNPPLHQFVEGDPFRMYRGKGEMTVWIPN